jgi:NAD(P)H-hydrate repair Nnr-like enzyme with NAD(P)H-hydrate dehydratase domain
MAKGGSGDVLTGVILGWMAKNYGPIESAMIPVYFCMDQQVTWPKKARGRLKGSLARDIVDMLPKACLKLFGQ